MEDEVHFLDVCPRWGKRRNAMWEVLRKGDGRVVGSVAGWDRSSRVDWLLEGGCSVRTRAVVLRSVGEWLFDRQKVGRGRPGSETWGEGMRPEEAARIAEVVAVRQAPFLPGIVAEAAVGAVAAVAAVKATERAAAKSGAGKSGAGKGGVGKGGVGRSGAGKGGAAKSGVG